MMIRPVSFLFRHFAIVPFLIAISPLQSDAAAREAVIEELVVTAEFRETDITALAASGSVIRPDEAGSTVQHLEEVLNRAPNVNFASGASRGRFIQIRGIGERGQFAEPLNSSVALIVDGVDLSGIGTAATLFDVAQVEVLRGPQGTLYGANALAGLINVVTHAPGEFHEGRVRLDAGNHGAQGLGVVVSGPLSERLGYRISGQKYVDDGFMDNDFLNRDDTDNHDEGSYRARLRWQGDKALADLSLGRVDINNGYDAFSLDNNRTTLSDRPGHDRQETHFAALNLQADLSRAVAIQAAYGFATSDIDYGYDEDWTFDGFDPWGYTSSDRYLRERDTHTLDVRLLSRPGQGLLDGAWDWLAGVYLFRQEVELERRYTFLPGPFISSFDVDRLAVYGEVSGALTDTLRITLGARFEQHESEYDDALGVGFRPEDDLFGGRILLEQELLNGVLMYAGVTHGYKAGGFNTQGIDDTLPEDLRQYDPESLWNIELGYKARLLNDRAVLRAALFRMQREDIQISTSTERPIPDSNAVQFIEYTGNAAEGFNQGVELELRLAATDDLMLFANIGWLDSEYEDYIDNSGRDLDGREQAHAPSYNFFAGAEYAFARHWKGRLEIEGKDAFYFSNSHAAQSDSYEVFNASIAYETGRWSVRLWGRNLTDEDYHVRGFFFGNDPRDFYTARPFTQLGEPRRYGISVQVNW